MEQVQPIKIRYKHKLENQAIVIRNSLAGLLSFFPQQSTVSSQC
jgi:hypothetical protein